jgi:hypothetical protein
MDLLDRYLAAVAALLPKTQREDIVAELRDTLLNRMEEKEAELGRPLTDKEREAVLKAFGHPIAVAGRFGNPRALIGPEIYPFYIFGVKVLVVVAGAVSLIQLLVSTITNPGEVADVLRLMSSLVSTSFTMIGIATVLAAGIERGWFPLTGMTDWRVADLPVLDALGTSRRGFLNKSGHQRRLEALLEVILIALFMLWWTGVIQAPWSNQVANGDMVLQPAPIWAKLYWPILVWSGAQLLSGLVGLVRPAWVRVRAAVDVVCGLAGLILAAVLWHAGRLIVVAALGAGQGTAQGGGGPSAEQIAGLQTSLDLSLHLTTTVMTAVLTVKIVIDLWRLFRGARPAISVTA